MKSEELEQSERSKQKVAMLVDKRVYVSRVLEVLIYGIFYLTSFKLLETREVSVDIIHTAIDDKIPFISAFIIPYFLWFAYVGITVAYFIFFCESEAEYYKMTRCLAVGCTIFLIISFVFPNGQDLRPAVLGNGIFDQMVAHLYTMDTPTNVFPSIHVYNTLICALALYENENFRKSRICVICNFLLAISIILATMCLKQHTVVDVIGAMILASFCVEYYYGTSTATVLHQRKVRHGFH